MKMKKILGMLLLAGAVAAAATSCNDEEKGPIINQIYEGVSAKITLGDSVIIEKENLIVLTALNTTELITSIDLYGDTIDLLMKLNNLTAKQFSKNADSYNGTLFKVESVNMKLSVGAESATEATIALQGEEIAPVIGEDEFGTFHGGEFAITGSGQTRREVSAYLTGAVTGLPGVNDGANTKITILLQGEK